MKLSGMRELLSARGIKLTKSLGQNFLHDGNQLRRILEAADLTKADKVLEIGPGLGPLTEFLVQRAGHVLAIEKDGRLVEILRERFNVGPTSRPSLTVPEMETGATPVLHLVHDDALEFLRCETRDWSQWKLVANLPYSVASPILVELSQSAKRPQRMVVTLQMEVAQRLMARTGDKDYGVLTLLIQLDYEPRAWFKIPASCFFPVPDVDSACVVLVRRAKTLIPPQHRDEFVGIVKQAFSQRRKMAMKLLKSLKSEERLAATFAELNISPQARGENLSLQQFVEMTRKLAV